MKIKKLACLLAFATTLTVSVFVYLPFSSNDVSINNVPAVNTDETDAAVQGRILVLLRSDFKNRHFEFEQLKRRQEISGPVTKNQLMSEWADETETADLSGLPEDFQAAWLRYATATRAIAELTNRQESFSDGQAGEMTTADECRSKFASYAAAKRNLLFVADRYGVIFNL